MHLWVRKLELFQSDCNLIKCTYFKPTATISILLHLFQANVTRIETIWFFMFRANFNNFNLTAPFLSGVSYFFVMLFPYFEQISQNNGPFRINFNSFQLYVCVHVCLRHLTRFQDDCTCSKPHTIFSLKSCTAFNSTAVMRPRWVRYF